MKWEERRGKWWQHSEDARTPYDIDYARIVHSGSFRRLQGKTQVLNLGDSDFYRTRLTHSLEVAQIANSLVRQLRNDDTHEAHQYLPKEPLIQSLGLAHDLGHPPFGHGGEVALNYCMRNDGGFEGNGQTLRILSQLENFSENCGADLTRRTLLGVLKYPVCYDDVANPSIIPEMKEELCSIRVINRKKAKPPKCYLKTERDVVNWILEPLSPEDREKFTATDKKLSDAKGEARHAKALYKSFDCSIMDVADDIAYGVHDLEDAIAMKLVTEREFRNLITVDVCSEFLSSLVKKDPTKSSDDLYELFVHGLFGNGKERKHWISRVVHHFVTNIRIVSIGEFKEPLINFRADLPNAQKSFLDALRAFVVDRVIRSPEVQHLEFKGQKMVVSVFEAIASDPKSLLPLAAQNGGSLSASDNRAVCDYVAGMTDGFLLKTYERLFSPRMGSVFDRL